MDADNIIVGEDWLQRLIKPLSENIDIIGVESNYLIAPDFTSINKYATLLIIVDPLARLLASKPKLVTAADGYIVKEYSQGSAPVAGANGFLWRRSVLEPYAVNTNTLEETTILHLMASKDTIAIANVPGVGIYHYYCRSVKDYLLKRKKIATKHLARKAKKKTWVESRSKIRACFATLYLASVIGPLIEATYSLGRTKQKSWLWHPFISFSTVCIYGWQAIADKFSKR